MADTLERKTTEEGPQPSVLPYMTVYAACVKRGIKPTHTNLRTVASELAHGRQVIPVDGYGYWLGQA